MHQKDGSAPTGTAIDGDTEASASTLECLEAHLQQWRQDRGGKVPFQRSRASSSDASSESR